MTQVQSHSAEELPEEAAAELARQTLLGSVSFASLWRALGGTPVYWVAYDSHEPSAVFTSVRFGRGPWARLQAMPDGLYARVISLKREAGLEEASRAILRKIGAAGFARVYLNDFGGQFDKPEGFDPTPCATSLVRLEEDVWEPPDKKLQSEIRKAQREQVPVETFAAERHFDAFIDLMRQTEERHGRQPKYPVPFYENLARLAAVEPRICWRVCEQDGRLAASHLYLLEGDMLLNWQVFFDKKYSALKPNQLIMYATAREMAARGAATLNLGASPDSAESLAAYKDKWGGEAHRYTCWTRRSWLGRLV